MNHANAHKCVWWYDILQLIGCNVQDWYDKYGIMKKSSHEHAYIKQFYAQKQTS